MKSRARISRLLPGLLIAGIVLNIAVPRLEAQDIQQALQQAEAILGRPISEQEALQLLQQSGLTADQVRDRLESRGFTRDAADPYLSVLEGQTDLVPAGTSPVPLVEALSGAGANASGAVGRASVLPGMAAADTTREAGPPIFGRQVFQRATSQFLTLSTGPAPANYRVGPGDEIALVVTGDVELAYRLVVSRDGWVVIPDVGRIDVSGATIAELRERFRQRLSAVYSGLTGDEDATTFLDLSLGSLRTNLVYVIGEVERPGAYEISSFASVFAALYPAGGPSRTGSFREIRVNRGPDLHATVDLYDYLLDGRAGSAPHLQQGDIVFVPVAGRRVELDGAIVRPGIYELVEGDDLGDVLEFAGGLTASASAARVQIERVLPPEEQEPGLNRVLLDVPISGPDARRDVSLVDGDRITVFAVLEDVRNTVHVTGGVWRPGVYGVEPGIRLWDVIERAGGLLPDAFEGRVQIQRLQEDYTRRMIHVTLEKDAAGIPTSNPEIEPLDQIYVFASRNLREQRAVSIGGWVRQPGVYPYVEGMTVRDLVLRAGGLRTGAFLGAADIARVSIGQERSDTITQTFSVALDSSLVFDARSSARVDTASSSADFPLLNLDAVYVRKAPGFEPQRRVVVGGEVRFPGPYSVQSRTERIVDLITRAGGMTNEAYAEGMQLWRQETSGEDEVLTGAEIAGQAFGDTALIGVAPDRRAEEEGAAPGRQAAGRGPTDRSGASSRTRVGVDYVEAARDPGSSHNVLVEPGDSIFVPHFIPTVDVRGAVQAPTKVLFKDGASGDYYIERAGGYLQHADKGRARVQFANGEIHTRGGKFLFFGGGLPVPDPGSVITVPLKEEKPPGPGTLQVLAVITGLVTATATVILAATK